MTSGSKLGARIYEQTLATVFDKNLPQSQFKLWDILKECQWPIDSRVALIRNLTEAGEKHFAPQKVNETN